MKIAIVHDWLSGMRGGEKVLETMFELFPEAELYTLFHMKGSVSPLIEQRKIHTSFINHFPLLKSHYRYYLPFFPTAIQNLTIENVDLVISSSHCVAKGIRIQKNIPHICYCYTPMRYLWALPDLYFKRDKKITNLFFSFFSQRLKAWDLSSNDNVDHFIGISRYISQRIKRYYDREAEVIYPPVDINQFFISSNIKNYYLIVSALVPYKRVDLAILAFNKLGYSLVIVGRGPEEKRLKKIAHSNISFLGWQSQQTLPKLLSECKAFIFPGEEDFGIAPLEAMACGRPVIAYAKGGALETVTPQTGIFFHEQTEASLISAVQIYERKKDTFQPKKMRTQAELFSKEIFIAKLKTYIQKKYPDLIC